MGIRWEKYRYREVALNKLIYELEEVPGRHVALGGLLGIIDARTRTIIWIAQFRGSNTYAGSERILAHPARSTGGSR